jgi:flagellar hook assembly protein FlgD
MNVRTIALFALAASFLTLPILIPSDLPASQSISLGRKVYPNPFTVNTTFELTMPTAGIVSIAVFDILGKHVVTLQDRVAFPAGVHPIPWDGNDKEGQPVIPGVYICSLFSDNTVVKSVKVVKIKG